jgi:hypothetical protein
MDNGTGCFVQSILTNVGNTSMEPRHLMASFLAIFGPFFTAGKMALVALQSFEVCPQRLGVLDRWATIRADSERGYAKINSDGRTRSLNPLRNNFLDQHTDIPLASPFANGCGEHVASIGRNIAVFFEANDTQSGQLNAIFKHTDGLV